MAGPARMPAVGSATPSFAAQTLDGKPIRMPEDFKNRFVLLDFWATWCLPCRAEIPRLIEAHEQFGDKGLTIVGLSLDTSPTRDVQRFVTENKMSWPQIQADAARIAESYGVQAIPTSFLIDGNTGKVVAAGDALHGEELGKTLARLLTRAGS